MNTLIILFGIAIVLSIIAMRLYVKLKGSKLKKIEKSTTKNEEKYKEQFQRTLDKYQEAMNKPIDRKNLYLGIIVEDFIKSDTGKSYLVVEWNNSFQSLMEKYPDYLFYSTFLTWDGVDIFKAQLEDDTKVTVIKKKELKEANILIVENNLINQKIVTLSIQKFVNHIDTAINGQEAINKFITRKYDLIIMGVQIPEMDGIQTTIKIREIEAKEGITRTPVIAHANHFLVGEREECFAAGMDDFWGEKPAQVGILVRKMKNLLAQRNS
jgi:osomolarity two-component system sensor histidine kinase NIK1